MQGSKCFRVIWRSFWKKDNFEKLLEKRQEITGEFQKAGFDYTAMDLEGYRTGSMNEVLN